LADEPIEVFWTLRFRVIRNFGGSFGVAQGGGTVISLIGIVVIGGLLYAASKPRPTATIVALGFFIGGAAGNILDRIVREGSGVFGGGVVDFIDFQWWPVFNVADISLYIGVGLLLLVGLEEPPDETADA
jgi:signal peptidase II